MSFTPPAVGDPITAAFGDALTPILNAWTTYTPALTAATTNPTLGTGNAISGRYVQVGKTVIGEVSIIFGTSGAAAGSGAYFISPPATPSAGSNNMIVGNGRLRCAGSFTPVTMFLAGGVFIPQYISAAVNGGTINASNSTPGAWTNNDSIIFTFAYEAA